MFLVSPMQEFGEFWPESKQDAPRAYQAWEAWAQHHDPPFHIDDILRDLLDAARNEETVPYGRFMDKYGLSRGGRRDVEEDLNHGVGWVVGVVAAVFHYNTGIDLDLSALAVGRNSNVPSGLGVHFPTKNSEKSGKGWTSFCKREQKSVWDYFGDLPVEEYRALDTTFRTEAASEDDIETSRQLIRRLKEGREAPDSWTRTRTRALAGDFRRFVLLNFHGRCAVCSVDMGVLLDAAHVKSYAEHPELRTDFRNGILLCKLHHAAYDAELISFDRNGRIRTSAEVRASRNPMVREMLGKYHGGSLGKHRWSIGLA